MIIRVLILSSAVLAIARPLHSVHWAWDGVPVCVYNSTKTSQKVAPDGSGGAFVVWAERRFGNDDIFIQRIDSAGTVLWAADGVPATTSTLNDNAPRVISDGADGAIVAWGGSDRVMAQRLDPAGNRLWTDEGVLLATGLYASVPFPVSDGKGGAIIAWDVGYGNHNIYAQRVRADGVTLWGANGTPVCTEGSHQRAPRAVADGSGGVIIVWRDERPAYLSDIYAQRVDSTGACLWATDGIAVASEYNNEDQHDAVSDMAGGAIVCWHVGSGTASSRDVYAQRIDGSGARLWDAHGVEICADTMGQERPRLATDGAGGAIIAWYDYCDCPWNYYSDIYAQKLSASGVPQWAVGGVPVCTQEHKQNTVEIAPNGTGGAALVWMDLRFDGYCLYGDIIDGDGNCLWGSNGFPVCINEEMQQSPVVASDGSGGGIFVWNDKRGPGMNIYAQRLNLNFSPATGDDPMPLPDATFLSQNFPNPFNPNTTIAFELEMGTFVNLSIYNAAGKLVAVLIDESRPAGPYSTVWNGKDKNGTSAASGVYFYRLTACQYEETKKMILLR